MVLTTCLLQDESADYRERSRYCQLLLPIIGKQLTAKAQDAETPRQVESVGSKFPLAFVFLATLCLGALAVRGQLPDGN